MATSRRGVHGAVVDAIGQRIASGELPADRILTMESIQSEFLTSRTVAREAIRELTGKGLVEARPRRGTYVRERSNWSLLDPDVMAWRSAAGPDRRLLEDLGQVRQLVEPGAARLAADNASEDELSLIGRALERLEANEGNDLEAAIEADAAFHLGILAASGNELLGQFGVLLLPALRARDMVSLRHDHGRDYLGYHRALYEALAARDGDGAEAASHRLLEVAVEHASKDVDR
jgi:DNA-binding FadR family transcriptional regulator